MLCAKSLEVEHQLIGLYETLKMIVLYFDSVDIKVYLDSKSLSKFQKMTAL